MMKWARVRFRGAPFNWRGSGEIFDDVRMAVQMLPMVRVEARPK